MNYSDLVESTLTIEYPNSLPTLANQSVADFEQESKLALALAKKMYELVRWSSGQVARDAGVSRAQLLLEYPRFHVATATWDEDEIEAEFSGQKAK